MKKIPDQKSGLKLKIQKDLKRILKTSNSFCNKEKVCKNNAINNFLMEWSYIENLLLPSLVRQIAGALSFKDIPKIEYTPFSQLINYYYFISHDKNLYDNLVKGNKIRNKLLHSFEENHIKNDFKDESLKAYKYIVKKITLPILFRMKGEVVVPVLSLYSKGWNDLREKLIKEKTQRLNKLKRELSKK